MKIIYYSIIKLIITTIIFTLPIFAQNPVQIKYNEVLEKYDWEDYDNAILIIQEIITDFPTSDLIDDVQYLLGQSYIRTERYDDAIFTLYTTAYTYPWSNSAEDALMALAGALYHENHIAETLETYEQLVEKYPQSKHAAYAQTCIGWLYGGMNDPQKAKVELQKVITNYPTSSYVDIASESISHINSEQRISNDQSDNPNDALYMNTSISNKNPVVNFEIGTVSGGPFEAPVWVKFYPSGTYDPDGYIILFEIDMNGDGVYDVIEKSLTGGSYEFTSPGEYTASVRVTDEKGGTTVKSKSFAIAGQFIEENKATEVVVEPKIYEKPETSIITKPKDDEVNKKLDSIIEDFKTQVEIPQITEETKKVTDKKTKINSKDQNIEPLSKNNKVTYRQKNKNIIENGSFEEPIINAAYQSLNIGTDIGGWTVSEGAIDLVGNYFNNSDGNQSIDLHGTPGFGAVKQTIATKPSTKYEICFDLAGNAGGPPTIKKVKVTAAMDSEEFEFDCTGKSPKQMGWVTRKWIFTAIDNFTTISFSTLHNSGNATAGPVIDNVKVFELETVEVVDDTKTKKKKSKKKKKSNSKEEEFEGLRIESGADTYVYAYSYRNWSDANFGKHNIIIAGWHSTGGEKRAYLKFDVPNIDSEFIETATLKLYHHKLIGKNTSAIKIYKITEDWTEGDGLLHEGQSEPIDSTGVITWNMQPSYNDSVITQFTPKKKTNKWIEIDITSLVKDWINGEPNYGIVLKPGGNLSGREPTSLYEFYSKDYEDTSKIPYVEIQLK